MSTRCVLFPGEGAWRIAATTNGETRVETVAPDGEPTLDALAEAARETLAAVGDPDRPVVLALPSAWCLCARIATENLERGKRRRSMAFRLEEHLPLSAEDFVADYIELNDREAIGICAELANLEAILNACETAGLHVLHICPAALLAAASVADQHPGLDGVLVAGPGTSGSSDSPGHDLVELHGAAPTNWWWFADDERGLRDRIATWTASASLPLRLAVIALDDAAAADEALDGVEVVTLTGVTADQAAAHHAARLLEDAASTNIDLRRDALAPPTQYQAYRKPVGALAVALVFLLVSVCAVAQWRGRQYDALSTRYYQQQRGVFEETLPDQRVPGSIRQRLASERRKLAGLGGQASGRVDPDALRPRSALVQLAAILEALPRKGPRYRILDLSIEPDRIRADGQARNYAEAERVAFSLRGAAGYAVDPPETQSLRDRGVSFSFTATPSSGSPVPRNSE